MYTPSKKILQKYADVLVNFALGGGKGIKKGEVVLLLVPECAKPFLYELRSAVLKAGGHVITQYLPDDFARGFFEEASDEQINFFASKFYKGLVDQVDHYLGILGETNKYELKGIDPKKIMAKGEASKKYREWMDEKEAKGKFTWTLALYGTPHMAKDAGMSLKEYWKQIIKGCYLDTANPIAKWRATFREIERLKKKMNSLDIDSLRVEARGTDLIIGLDKNRMWLGGDGRNIPSYEIFISPDMRRTEGHISFSEPLFRYGNMAKGISLEFKKGKVMKVDATEGKGWLTQMIETKNANMVGEFSLTDSRFSKITRFMGETLFDENTGGKYGNTHIALGSAYKDSFPGVVSKVPKKKWRQMGYNESSVHTDIVSTTDRTVTAMLKNGKQLVIYKKGKFTL